MDCAQLDIPVQVEADPRPTGTDARSIRYPKIVPTGLENSTPLHAYPK